MAERSEYKGWTWGIVDVPVEKLFGPAEKINITVPSLLLKRIDAMLLEPVKRAAAFSPKRPWRPCRHLARTIRAALSETS